MGTKKWSEIKKLSKATDADRAEARAELEAENRSASGPWTIQQILDRQDELADRFEAFDPSEGGNSRRRSSSNAAADRLEFL